MINARETVYMYTVYIIQATLHTFWYVVIPRVNLGRGLVSHNDCEHIEINSDGLCMTMKWGILLKRDPFILLAWTTCNLCIVNSNMESVDIPVCVCKSCFPAQSNQIQDFVPHYFTLKSCNLLMCSFALISKEMDSKSLPVSKPTTS